MNAPLNFLVHALMAAFVAGCAGCAVLIPLVGVKFVSVLFEKDLPGDAAAGQE